MEKKYHKKANKPIICKPKWFDEKNHNEKMFFLNQPTVHHRLAKQNSRRKRSGQKKYSSLDNAPTASVTQRTICWISIS